MNSVKTLLITSSLAFFATINISYAGCDPKCGSGQTCGYNGTSGEFACRDTKGIKRADPKMIEREGPSELDKLEAEVQQQKTEKALRDSLKAASEPKKIR